MKYDAVIFDVGDTLVQYVPTIEEQYMQRLKELGESVTQKEVQSMIEAAKRTEYEQLIREWNGAPRMEDEPYLRMQAEAALRDVYSAHSVERLLPMFMEAPITYDGKEVKAEVKETLEHLKTHGYKLGIVSNDSPRLRSFLQEKGLAEYFDVIVISGEEGIEKPDPQIMKIAMKRMNAVPQKCLYVGDHPFDVLCAKHAGMDCAWIASERMALPIGIDVTEDYRISGVIEIVKIVAL